MMKIVALTAIVSCLSAAEASGGYGGGHGAQVHHTGGHGGGGYGHGGGYGPDGSHYNWYFSPGGYKGKASVKMQKQPYGKFTYSVQEHGQGGGGYGKGGGYGGGGYGKGGGYGGGGYGKGGGGGYGKGLRGGGHGGHDTIPSKTFHIAHVQEERLVVLQVGQSFYLILEIRH
ncbi:unnamed protein product [Cyprideis torosa]|uniref:Uncharacterized protein n=1 Tax=Cyprideis torosa TaxID=163714 RepID=A0A7R8W5H0_9CRUS|nr:unnamed protein product [Cyprideis torosa]CAG0885288.1 unnamed protein product [Cyprideis torosa]